MKYTRARHQSDKALQLITDQVVPKVFSAQVLPGGADEAGEATVTVATSDPPAALAAMADPAAEAPPVSPDKASDDAGDKSAVARRGIDPAAPVTTAGAAEHADQGVGRRNRRQVDATQPVSEGRPTSRPAVDLRIGLAADQMPLLDATAARYKASCQELVTELWRRVRERDAAGRDWRPHAACSADVGRRVTLHKTTWHMPDAARLAMRAWMRDPFGSLSDHRRVSAFVSALVQEELGRMAEADQRN